MKRIEPGRLECSFRTELGCLAKVLLVLGDMKKTLKVTGRADLITVCLRKVILAVTRRMNIRSTYCEEDKFDSFARAKTQDKGE